MHLIVIFLSTVVRYVIAEGHRGVVARTVLEGRVLDAGAASVAIITLLNKKSRRRNGMQPDYEGFECEVGEPLPST